MRPAPKVLVVVALLLLALLGGSSTAGHAATTRARPSFLWGAWIGNQFTGKEAPWDWNAVTDFETRNAGGRHVNAVHWGVGTPWAHQFNYWLGPFNMVNNAGAVSVVDMVTGTAKLRKVADGAFDPAFRKWATQAAAWGHPLLLRFDFEMNGQWFPWGTRPLNRNKPRDFVAAWRHVHRIFTAAGATNVGWVWCPNVDPLRDMTGVARLWPGRSYVDYTCLDGYNFGRSWMSFSKLYTNTYRRIVRIAPSTPMLIGEVASIGRGPNKARWIRGMFNALPTHFRHVHGLLWWDKWGYKDNRRLDWPLETSRAASVAFSKGISHTLARTCRGLAGDPRAVCMGTAAAPPPADG